MLLANASSNALCVTDASAIISLHLTRRTKMKGWLKMYSPSKSLKLLPMLGLPSLPSLPFPGLLPANSAVRLGLSGPGFFPFPRVTSTLLRGAAELALESDVCDTCVTSAFLCIGVLLLEISCGSPRKVADGSWLGVDVNGRKAGSSSPSEAPEELRPSFGAGANLGRRMKRDCTGELLAEDVALSEGEERGSGRGERWGEFVEAFAVEGL